MGFFTVIGVIVVIILVILFVRVLIPSEENQQQNTLSYQRIWIARSEIVDLIKKRYDTAVNTALSNRLLVESSSKDSVIFAAIESTKYELEANAGNIAYKYSMSKEDTLNMLNETHAKVVSKYLQ